MAQQSRDFMAADCQVFTVPDHQLVFLVQAQPGESTPLWGTMDLDRHQENQKTPLKFLFSLDSGDRYRVYQCAVEFAEECDGILRNYEKELITVSNWMETEQVHHLSSFDDQGSVLKIQSANGPRIAAIHHKELKQQVVDQMKTDFYWNILRHLTGQSPLPYLNITARIPDEFEPRGPFIRPESEAFQNPIQSRWSAYLPSRYTYAQNFHNTATNYMLTYFASLGFQIRLQPWLIGNQKAYNVLAYCIGAKRPDELVLVGAHYDSTSEIPRERAPGAVDDGSGSAGVMLLAYAFSKNPQTCSDRSVMFAVFGGEEQGLLGSKFFVSQLEKNRGIELNQDVTAKPVSAILMDMIAYSKKYFGVTIEGTTNGKIQNLMRLTKKNMNQMSPSLTVHSSPVSFGSDHVSFQRANIPAILLIEQDDTNYPNYHSSKDDLNEDNVNRDQAVDILRGLAGTVVDLVLN